MHWMFASLVAAFFLGCYDLSTKHAVRSNAVLPVLFLANLCSSGVWILFLGGQWLWTSSWPAMLTVAPLSWSQHGQLALKSLIVALSWVCSYFAVKQLPISIAAPIRATGPMWTLCGALLLLGERPSWIQLIGVATTLGSFVALSLVGGEEGIHFHRNKWIGWLIAGTLLGGGSSLYDKFLLSRQGFAASTVQAWFVFYLTLFFLPLAVGWKSRWWKRETFQWRWSVVLVSIFLLLSDFIYFNALTNPDAMVSVVASLRRGSALVAFAGGLVLFDEVNGWKKFPVVLGILVGILLTILG